MTDEMKRQIKKNELTIERWKENRLAEILNQSVRLPGEAQAAFNRITDQFTGVFSGSDLRKKVDAQMPTLWEMFQPPQNENEWTDYFNDLLADCAAAQCVTVREVWQIIGYDPAEFENMRTRQHTFAGAFGYMCMDETLEQRCERTKDLTPEQSRERIAHGVKQWREGMVEIARLQRDAFDRFGEIIPLPDDNEL